MIQCVVTTFPNTWIGFCISYYLACGKRKFLVRMRWFFLSSNTNNILCSSYSNLNARKYYLNTVNERLQILDLIFTCRNLNQLSIKYESYPKSRKINAIRQDIWLCPNCYKFCVSLGILFYISSALSLSLPDFHWQGFTLLLGMQVLCHCSDAFWSVRRSILSDHFFRSSLKPAAVFWLEQALTFFFVYSFFRKVSRWWVSSLGCRDTNLCTNKLGILLQCTRQSRFVYPLLQ